MSEITSGVYTFTYSASKRLLAILCFALISSIGVFCLLIDTLFTNIFGTALIIALLINIVNIAFFKVLTIDKDGVRKEWYFFGEKSIKTADLRAISTKKLWDGSIIFRDKNRYGFQNFCMNFETFLLKDSYAAIRDALVENGVISGCEPCWNTDKKKKSFWGGIFYGK